MATLRNERVLWIRLITTSMVVELQQPLLVKLSLYWLLFHGGNVYNPYAGLAGFGSQTGGRSFVHIVPLCIPYSEVVFNTY